MRTEALTLRGKRWCFAQGMTLLMAMVSIGASARPAIYWATTQGTGVSLDYLEFSSADLENPVAGDTNGQRSVISGQYEFAPQGNWLLGGGHEYNPLDFDLETGEPRSNGHHHTLHLAGRWRRQWQQATFEVTLAPAISVSSNALKNPGEIDSDALQLWAAGIYTHRTHSVEWIGGLVSDNRFGDARLYPVAGLRWSGDNNEVLLTWPDLLLQQRWGNWSVQFSTSPDGNLWRTWDRELEYSDDFRREAWGGELALRYGFKYGVRAGFALGYHWDQQWKFTDSDGNTLRTGSEDSAYIALHLSWNQ